MEFVDRKEEMRVLKDAYAQADSSLVTIYGRRRIGKTELVTRFVAGTEHGIYYMATKEDVANQLKSLSAKVGMVLGDEELIRFGAVDWEALFLRISNKGTKRRIVLAIDEFPYLAKANKAISSIFQKGWDVYLKKSDVVLVLCGSSVSMMHSEVLDYSAPLYQRSTSVIEMKPLGIDYALSLNRLMKFEDRMYLYFIFGGIPAYYAYTETCRTINDAIHSIFRPGSVFLNEPSTILSEETKSEARYMDVLDLISAGVNRTNEIASKIKVAPSNLTRYLDVLDRIGLIRRISPITERQSSRSKKGIYEITDNYMRFWFRYVKRNREALEVAGSDVVSEKVAKELTGMAGMAFEAFSIEFVKHFAGRIFPRLSKVGRWWGKDPSKIPASGQEEIDIVGLNEDTGEMLFAECKWSGSKAGVDVYAELRRRAALVSQGKGRKEHFALFSKSGFTDAMKHTAEKEGVLLFDLRAIEQALSTQDK